MVRCAEAALADAGGSGLRGRVEAVRVVQGIWPYRDPGRLVAERLGRPDAETTMTTLGGQQVYDLVIDTADRIASGDLDVAVVCAAESLRTRRADRARGVDSPYLAEREGAAPDRIVGSATPLNTDEEREIGVHHAPRFYAMAEAALRHRLGEGIDDHRRRIAALWARASEVAAANPNAWLRNALTAHDIATTGERNRPIAAPYPKLMTSNLDVDQGGAVVMCSVGAAAAAGVPRDRWIFPWAGAGAADHWYPTNRWAFDESPAMRLVGDATLDLAGLGSVDAECELIDLYSCFPVAVQVAQREMKIPADRDFTITGGLTFAAGPMNCYCILPLTRAVDLLRQAPGQKAFLTGNGGYFTKHSALVMSGEPSAGGWRTAHPQAEVDALPSRPTPGAATHATLETYTVTFDRDMQPERAILACLDEAGGRHWAESNDADTLQELLGSDACGRAVRLDGTTAHLD
jgi:acetyl-CoA C-acetyltransferase